MTSNQQPTALTANGRLTAKQLDPILNGVGWLRFFDMLQRFVDQDISDGSIVLARNFSIQQALASHPGLLQLYSSPEGQLYHDAATEARRYAIVPKRCITLKKIRALAKNAGTTISSYRKAPPTYYRETNKLHTSRSFRPSRRTSSISVSLVCLSSW